MIELEPTEVDDPQFVELASQVLNGLIRLHAPQEGYLIQVDHWFAHKWQHFSGKILGAVGVWKSQLTVPPFDPGRIVSQCYFRARHPSSAIYHAEVAKPLHLDQWSSRNLELIRQISSSGLFLWCSGETRTMDQVPNGLFGTG